MIPLLKKQHINKLFLTINIDIRPDTKRGHFSIAEPLCPQAKTPSSRSNSTHRIGTENNAKTSTPPRPKKKKAEEQIHSHKRTGEDCALSSKQSKCHCMSDLLHAATLLYTNSLTKPSPSQLQIHLLQQKLPSRRSPPPSSPPLPIQKHHHRRRPLHILCRSLYVSSQRLLPSFPPQKTHTHHTLPTMDIVR